jgi:hypothetical protein
VTAPIKLSKVRAGIALAKEVVKAADQATNNDGKTTRRELAGICDAEGYTGRHTMRSGTLALHAEARRAAGGTAPDARAINRAGRSVFEEVSKASARGGRADTLEASEYETLSAPAKRLVDFSRKYAGGTIDAFFF